MADSIEKQQIAQMRSCSYSNFRDKLRTGDLMFASGNSPLSNMIRRATQSPWSHVGLVVRADTCNRVLLLESVLSVGVRFAPMSKYFGTTSQDHAYDGEIVVARHTGIDSGSSQISSLTGWGIDQLTRPYGYAKLISIAARIAFKFGSIDARQDAFVCSELVDGCFKKMNPAVAPFNRKDPKFISPADIWNNASVTMLTRLVQ